MLKNKDRKFLIKAINKIFKLKDRGKSVFLIKEHKEIDYFVYIPMKNIRLIWKKYNNWD